MSAYVLVELTVKDPEAMSRYSAAAAEAVKAFGGEFVVSGAWELLFGEPAFTRGAIARFKDQETALAWHNSPAYQAALGDRAVAMDCRLRLLTAA